MVALIPVVTRPVLVDLWNRWSGAGRRRTENARKVVDHATVSAGLVDLHVQRAVEHPELAPGIARDAGIGGGRGTARQIAFVAGVRWAIYSRRAFTSFIVCILEAVDSPWRQPRITARVVNDPIAHAILQHAVMILVEWPPEELAICVEILAPRSA